MSATVYDMTIERYHAGPGISRSGIQEFKRSPFHYWHKYLNPEKLAQEKPDIITGANAKEFGNVVHTYLLEPERFEKSYLVLDKVDRRKSVDKQRLEEAKSDGRAIVCAESFQEVVAMQRSINNSLSARGLMEGALYEKSIVWNDKDTDILCKVRPDIWHSNMIVDLKTSKNASHRAFQHDLFTFGYHLQAAMIHEALFALKGINMMNFIFIVVEKEPPHAVAVYQLDEKAVRFGIEEFKKILFELKDCMTNDTWNSYPNGIIDLPNYVYNKTNSEI